MQSMSLTLKMKRDGKFYPIEVPPLEKVSSKWLSGFQNQPVAGQFKDTHREVYILGDPALKGAWCADKITMSFEDFSHYWQYKLLEFGIDVFSRLEAREERVAIMTTEGLSKDEADRYCDTKPHMYGTQQELIHAGGER